MARIERVPVDSHAVDVHRDLSMVMRAYRPGPPQRMDGLSIGRCPATAEPGTETAADAMRSSRKSGSLGRCRLHGMTR